MKSICYIIPYFGKLPKNFDLWLLGCRYNSTVNWLIYTDDEIVYDCPDNVKIKHISFDQIKKRIESHFTFAVNIDTPWRLSFFKPAYGELFSEDIVGYDFWGHCDIDLMWGDIRRFYTDAILQKYQRVGYLGHSTLYKNTPDVNSRYKVQVPGKINYFDVFSGNKHFSFDERGIDYIYDYLNIPYYSETIFAHLKKYEAGFFLGAFPATCNKFNKYQIFTWEKGKLMRHYLDQNRIVSSEFMYIHFFCRPLKYKVRTIGVRTKLVIYPDCVTDKDIPITIDNIKRYGQRNKFSFIIESLWINRRKITLARLMQNVRNYKLDKEKKKRI